jgi:hypothetical protein
MLADETIGPKQTTYKQKEKNPFLTIQLLPQFGFGHRTPKPGIFDRPTLKTAYNWSSSSFGVWF